MTDKPDLRRVLEHYGADIHGDRRELQILCPVHDEQRPSCSVNFEKGLIHCMSCGFGGDSFAIIGMKEGLSEFREIVGAAERLFGGTYGSSGKPGRRGEGRRERGAGFRPAFKRQRILS